MPLNDGSLLVRDLRVAYRTRFILHNIFFQVKKMEAVAIVGTNGAGKTTLLKAIAGLAAARAESIIFDGEEIVNLNPEKRSRKGISYVPTTRGVFPSLSVRDNLEVGAFIISRAKKLQAQHGLERVFGLFPELGGHLQKPAGALSGGLQRMLAIAIGLIRFPKLLLIDEPTMGLSPHMAEVLLERLLALKLELSGLILTEHGVQKNFKGIDRVLVISDGRLIYEGLPDDAKLVAIADF